MTQRDHVSVVSFSVVDGGASGTLDNFLAYIESSPEQAELQALAEKAPLPKWMATSLSIAQAAKGLFIANGEDYYGTAYVTAALSKHGKLTGRVTTASSVLDFVGNAPLLYFAMKGTPGDLLLSLILNAGMLKLTNDCSTAASGGKKSSVIWSLVGASGMIALSVIRSIASPIGSELLNNMPAINQTKAGELIQTHEQRLEDTKKQPAPDYEAEVQSCNELKQELSRLDHSDPKRASLYVQAHGQWVDRNKNWDGYDVKQIPVCNRVDRLRDQHLAVYNVAKQDWQAKLKQRSIIGSDIGFLKQEVPQLYAENFDAAGNVRSGVDAVRIASQNLFGKLQQGDWMGTGFSLFFFGISATTSATACFLSLSLAWRKDAQKSRSQAIIQVRDQWLEDCYRAFQKREQQ